MWARWATALPLARRGLVCVCFGCVCLPSVDSLSVCCFSVYLWCFLLGSAAQEPHGHATCMLVRSICTVAVGGVPWRALPNAIVCACPADVERVLSSASAWLYSDSARVCHAFTGDAVAKIPPAVAGAMHIGGGDGGGGGGGGGAAMQQLMLVRVGVART